MAFAIPSLDDTHGFLVAMFAALFPDADVSEGSPNWLWLRTQAGGVTDNHSHIFNVKNDLLPDTAQGDMLDRFGAIFGVTRKSATPARKDSAGRVFGTAGTNVPDQQQLNHASGLRFKINGATVVGAGGYVDANIVAIDTGSATRLNAGEILTFAATPAGLQDSVELQLALDQDGVDQESDGDYRARILLRLSSPPLGGAATDYVQWALAQTGIAAAFCYPTRAGLGTVDLAALHAGSGASRVLNAGEVTALQTAIAALCPVAVTFRVLTVTTRAIDVEVLYLPDGDAASETDWDDSTPPLVLAWQPGGVANKLQFQGGTRPATMKAGDRLCIKPALGGGTGQAFTIQALSGADAVILESTPALAPANGDTIYAGGPLTEQIRSAIQALFDGLGTANPDATRYGTWEGNLRPGAIDRVTRSIAGVLDDTVSTPNAIVAASDFAYPNDGSIELLIAGRILARRSH